MTVICHPEFSLSAVGSGIHPTNRNASVDSLHSPFTTPSCYDSPFRSDHYRHDDGVGKWRHGVSDSLLFH